METDNNSREANGHLSDEEIAGWVDAVENNKTDQMPEVLVKHIKECLHCKKEIVAFRETLDDAEKVTDLEIRFVNKSLTQRIPSGPGKKMLLMAASLALLVTIGVITILFIRPAAPNTYELFAANFRPYENINNVRGTRNLTGDSTQLIENMGFYFYNQSKYDSAAFVFKHLYQKNPKSETIAFYLANSILASDQSPDEAILLLKELISRNTIFTPQSRWYLALAYLKKNKPQEARKELEILITVSDTYKPQCQKLLGDLK